MQEKWQQAQASGITRDQVLANLKDRKLIFQTQNGLYRTRFAETLRLMYLLRQRFKLNDWQTAPRLVNDMRVELRRRQYPKRDVDLSELLSILEQQNVSAHAREIVDVLLRDEKTGASLKLAKFQQRAITQQLNALSTRDINAFVIGAGTGAGKTKAFMFRHLLVLHKILISTDIMFN